MTAKKKAKKFNRDQAMGQFEKLEVFLKMITDIEDAVERMEFATKSNFGEGVDPVIVEALQDWLYEVKMDLIPHSNKLYDASRVLRKKLTGVDRE